VEKVFSSQDFSSFVNSDNKTSFLSSSSSSFVENIESENDSLVAIDDKRKKKNRKRKSKKRKHKQEREPLSSETDYTSYSDIDSDSSNRNVKRKKKKKKKSSKKKKKKSVYEAPPSELKKKKPDTIWLEETSLDPEEAYRKDKRPDMHNYEYQSLYKMNVPRFYPMTKGLCLGAGSGCCPAKKRRRKKDGQTTGRYFSAKKNADFGDVTEFDSTGDFVHTVESANFIPIQSNRPQEDRSEQTPALNELSSRQKDFSQRLLDNPTDVRTWIEYVDAQEELGPWLNDLKDKESWLSSNSLRDRKISILEKAIVKNPASSELILKHMHLVKEIWSSSDVKEKWKKLVFQFPNRSSIWLEYTLFMQSDLVRTSVNQVVDMYRKAFRMLLAIQNGVMRSHRREANSSDGIVMVLTQFVLFLWQAGISFYFKTVNGLII